MINVAKINSNPAITKTGYVNRNVEVNNSPRSVRPAFSRKSVNTKIQIKNTTIVIGTEPDETMFYVYAVALG